MVEKFKTKQEDFWAGKFGSEYIGRNQGARILASNLNFLSKALKQAGRISSCLEFGANIGMNLKALRLLYPEIFLKAIEINPDAVELLNNTVGCDDIFAGSIFDYQVTEKVELCLIKGVLIHINPDLLSTVYDKLYQASNRLILICEYYNPTPVTISYRGHSDRLFKRDFAGEMLDRFPDLALLDYGFTYRRDPAFPQDDATWFLLSKR